METVIASVLKTTTGMNTAVARTEIAGANTVASPAGKEIGIVSVTEMTIVSYLKA